MSAQPCTNAAWPEAIEPVDVPGYVAHGAHCSGCAPVLQLGASA